jgi:hypothetical protein
LARWGQQLRQESRALARDTQTAIARSLLTNTAPPCLPAIAGVTEPFHAAVARDKLDPQFRSYRAWMEMLYSGNLTRDQVQMVINYRAAHHDIILGIPTVYGHNTREWGGFLHTRIPPIAPQPDGPPLHPRHVDGTGDTAR